MGTVSPMPSEPILKTRRHQQLDIALARQPLPRVSGKGTVANLRDYAADRRGHLHSWRTMAAELARHLDDLAPSDKNLWDWFGTDPEVVAAHEQARP